jgi:hypothetical protein
MIIAGLPKEVTEACAPILIKYGITDTKHIGYALKAIGRAFGECASLLKKGKVQRAQQILAEQTEKTLRHHGITDNKQLAECGKELIFTLMDIFNKEVEKRVERSGKV